MLFDVFSELTIMFALVENNLKKSGLRIFSKARNEFCGICEAQLHQLIIR